MAHGKAAEKQPKKHPKHPKNTRKAIKTAVFRVFRLFFRLFLGCFTVSHSAPFSAVFRLFSMSGIWHLCRWPWRLQTYDIIGPVIFLRGNGHRPDQSHFLSPPKLVLEGALYSTSPPRIARYVLPPPFAVFQIWSCESIQSLLEFGMGGGCLSRLRRLF